jgi:hypothetical protein
MVGDYHKVTYCYTRSVSVIGMLLLRSFAPSYIYCHFLLIHSSKYPCLQNLFVPASCGGLVLRAEKGLSRVITNRLTGGPGLCDRRPLFLQARGVCLAYRAVSHLPPAIKRAPNTGAKPNMSRVIPTAGRVLN